MRAARNLQLVDRLPPVRGRYRACVAVSELVWFRVGGPAEVAVPGEQGGEGAEGQTRDRVQAHRAAEG